MPEKNGKNEDRIVSGIGKVTERRDKIITEVEKRKTESIPSENPAKFQIGRQGDMELFCYPYSDHEKVFLSVGDKIVSCEPRTLAKVFKRWGDRLMSVERRMRRGVSKYDSSSFGQKYLKAYNEGVEEIMDNLSTDGEGEFDK